MVTQYLWCLTLMVTASPAAPTSLMPSITQHQCLTWPSTSPMCICKFVQLLNDLYHYSTHRATQCQYHTSHSSAISTQNHLPTYGSVNTNVNSTHNNAKLTHDSENQPHSTCCREEGIYNLTIIGWNELSNCSGTVSTYVSNVHCGPPDVTIPDSTMDVEAPLQFLYSEGGIIPSTVTLDCEVTSNTK